MSKSIKLKNNIFLDCRSLYMKFYTLSFNSDYVYSADLDYICFRIGNIVILKINTIAFKANMPNYTPFITGLPTANGYIISYLFGGNASVGKTLRIDISYNLVQTHWTGDNDYGDSPNKQYSGMIIYTTSDN